MKNVLTVVLAAGLFLAASPAPLVAHHSQATYHNADGAISITGVVKRMEFTNPHSFIYLEVKGADGTVKLWALEMMSMRGLKMLGWLNDTVKIGDALTVAGRPARNGSAAMYAEAIKLPDGRMMRS